jgi:hypothetical protein
MRGGIPNEGNDKTSDELALANLLNQENKGKGFQGNRNNCRKKEHKSADWKVSKKEKDKKNKSNTNTQGGGNKKYCDHCGRDGNIEVEYFRKAWKSRI